MARREMVTKLDDFLRRRSKVALVVRRDELERSPGLREACRLFFGDAADERAREYFAEADAYAAPAGADSPPAGGPGAARPDGPAPPSGGPPARPEPPRLRPGPALARGNGA
jgi:hypothetical protein